MTLNLDSQVYPTDPTLDHESLGKLRRVKIGKTKNKKIKTLKLQLTVLWAYYSPQSTVAKIPAY